MKKFALAGAVGVMAFASGAWADCGCQSTNQSTPTRTTVFVDYQKPLCDLICADRFDWANLDITEKHFPTTQRPNRAVEMKVFTVQELVGETRCMTSKEVMQKMDDQGYRSAELPELLAYAKNNPDEQRKYPIVALGSVWRDFVGNRSVPCLYDIGGERVLSLRWFDVGWRSRYRVLGVRK